MAAAIRADNSRRDSACGLLSRFRQRSALISPYCGWNLWSPHICKTGGDRMSRCAIYRKRAQECLTLADKFTLIEIQDCLLSMALAWSRLAEVAPVLLESADDGKLAARD